MVAQDQKGVVVLCLEWDIVTGHVFDQAMGHLGNLCLYSSGKVSPR
ncbi:MAG: hypothetical protein F6K55_35850 [Moorea sp. SIO4A3]|nr:hypothetical protein [Moorena sp. SIO4A3]